MFCVRIDHLNDQELSIFGYTLVDEDDSFKVYRCYDGGEHYVDKDGPRRLFVDDMNDAIQMRSDDVLQIDLREDDD